MPATALGQHHFASGFGQQLVVFRPAFFWPAGGPLTGPNLTDRDEARTKRHVLVEDQGLLLAITVTGAHKDEGPLFEPLLEVT